MARASLALAVLVAAGRVAAAPPQIASAEHWVEKDGIKIYLWEKYAGAPSGKSVVVLAHGSATAGKESFDLQVPTKGSYSLMDFLAGERFDVFALDTLRFRGSTHPWSHLTEAL